MPSCIIHIRIKVAIFKPLYQYQYISLGLLILCLNSENLKKCISGEIHHFLSLPCCPSTLAYF